MRPDRGPGRKMMDDGSVRRPRKISAEEFARRWDMAFGKKEKKQGYSGDSSSND